MFGKRRSSRTKSNCPAGLEISIPTPVRDEEPPLSSIPSPFRPSPQPRVLVKRLSSCLPDELSPDPAFPSESEQQQQQQQQAESIPSPIASPSHSPKVSPNSSKSSSVAKPSRWFTSIMCQPRFVLSSGSPKQQYQSSSSQQQQQTRWTITSPLLLVAVFWAGVAVTTNYVCWVQRNTATADPTLAPHMLPFCHLGWQPPPATTTNSKPLVYSSISKSSATIQQRLQQRLVDQQQENANSSSNHAATESHASGSSSLPTLFGVNYNDHVGNEAKTSPSSSTTSTTTNEPTIQTQHSTKSHINTDDYRLSFTGHITLAPSERAMIQDLATVLQNNETADWVNRAAQVNWGGPNMDATSTDVTQWWYSNDNSNDAVDHLLYSYLYIMKWKEHPAFPFRLCGGADQDCRAHVAPLHTLQWREAYQPWMVSPMTMVENADGFVYHRGFSPPSAAGQHAIVWVRFGHVIQDDAAFFRAMLNSVDRAVGESLHASNGHVGKFNVVIDCDKFSLSKSAPTLQGLRQHITMLQDHYPNRLGMIYLSHLSRAGEMFLRVVLRFITKEVRDKIKILPSHDADKTREILQHVVEDEYIPDWLGGTDTYRYIQDEYYPSELRFSDEEAMAFETTMPYHAN